MVLNTSTEQQKSTYISIDRRDPDMTVKGTATVFANIARENGKVHTDDIKDEQFNVNSDGKYGGAGEHSACSRLVQHKSFHGTCNGTRWFEAETLVVHRRLFESRGDRTYENEEYVRSRSANESSLLKVFGQVGLVCSTQLILFAYFSLHSYCVFTPL